MSALTLEQAQVAKLEAETREIETRSARNEREAEMATERTDLRLKSLRLAVDRARLSLAQDKREARQGEIDVAKAERDEKVLLSDFKFQHTFHFFGGVDKGSVQPCIERLNMWHQMDPGCDMTIVFNSPGGSVIDGMALFDFIRFMRDKGHKITIIALGYAASMAGILLQAGDVRVMAKGSWLLIHEVAFSASGKIGEIEDQYRFGEKLKEQAAKIFIERSGGKLTREVLDANWTRKDWWLSSDESLALGLIDEIR